ncbi:Phosphoinositide phospholipase C 4 [Acorus calamus]|uniref:Phosphoinositide phospholipase C 4 n=1 Tax=Acorus calamus TaxID=4465 RepID=A0AAV9C4Y7_ACOCL|nr:Phosphoinositide phospholipase C 4 [Acorus calamus]
MEEHAFSASEYLVIITLEDHLTPDLQAEVAKIILSTKPPKEYRESKITTDKGSGSINAKEDDEEAWGKEVRDQKSHLDNEDRNDRDGSEHIHDEEDHDDDDPTSNKTTTPKYKRLITIHVGKPKGGLHEALREDPHKVRRLSLSEQELVKASKSHSMKLVEIDGVPADTILQKTKIIEDNWIPVWNEEFTFPLIVPEFALLRIEVCDYDPLEMDGFGGQTCLPVPELRTGV